MSFVLTRSLQLQPNISRRCVYGHQSNNIDRERHQRQPGGIFENDITLSNFATPSHVASTFKNKSWCHMKFYNDHQSYQRHSQNARADTSTFYDYSKRNKVQCFKSQHPQVWKTGSIGCTGSRQLLFVGDSHQMLRKKRFHNCKTVSESKFDSCSSENGGGDEIECVVEGEVCKKISTSRIVSQRRAPKVVETTTDESGYVIKVSKELMGVFQYVEKVKRAHIRELAKTLRQVALACLLLSCMKGVVTPLVEVLKTRPPSWGKLIMILGAFDAFAITYLALKASEPLERLSSLATESCGADMMGSIEKEEEHMLALAIDLVRLFRRLRNLALCTAVTQFAHILHSMLQLQKSYPNFAINIIKFVKSWLSTPWV